MDRRELTVEAPLLSLVPVPTFLMEEVCINLTMGVEDSITKKDTGSAETNPTAGFAFWGGKASVSEKALTKSESRRVIDQSAMYKIRVSASQYPAGEGMAKLAQIFASVIEPSGT
jgi:hypothetical protein